MDNQTHYFIVDTHPEKVASRRMPTPFPNLQQAMNALGFLRRHHRYPECLSIAQAAVEEQAAHAKPGEAPTH